MDKKNLPDKADELLTEMVNKGPITLASISAVPYFGGVLATFFSAKWLGIYKQRTDTLMRQFSDHLNSVDEQAVRRDYFDTPEGVDLLIKAVEQSGKTRSDEKRDLIARMLRGAAIDGMGEYSPEEYLNLISDLTPQELAVLRSAYEQNPGTGGEFRLWCMSACRSAGLDRVDLLMTIYRLAAHGLIQIAEKPPTKRRSGGREIVRERRDLDRIERIFVSPTVRKLIRLLELDKQG